MPPTRPHLIARRLPTAFVSAVVLLAAGCAQRGPMATRNPLVGSLREDVSQLESEKQDLVRKVTDLEAENRRLEDRLVQEQAHGQAMARRLDEARGAGSASLEAEDIETASQPAERRDAGRRIVPSSRPRNRPAPFAAIPGDLQPMSEPGDDLFEPSANSPAEPTRPKDGAGELFQDDGPLSARGADRPPWLALDDEAPRRR